MDKEELIALLGKVVEEALAAHREARAMRDLLEFTHMENVGLAGRVDKLQDLIKIMKTCSSCKYSNRPAAEHPCADCLGYEEWIPVINEDAWDHSRTESDNPGAEDDCADCKVEVIE